MSTVAMPSLHDVNLKSNRLDERIDWYDKAVGVEPNYQTGIHHTACEYSSMEELLATYIRLRDEHGTTTSFYCVDPDGNSVELQSVDPAQMSR